MTGGFNMGQQYKISKSSMILEMLEYLLSKVKNNSSCLKCGLVMPQFEERREFFEKFISILLTQNELRSLAKGLAEIDNAKQMNFLTRKGGKRTFDISLQQLRECISIQEFAKILKGI